MVSLYKQKTSPNWYARVKVDGKDRWISSGTSDKRQARKILEKKIAALKGTANVDDCFTDLLKSIEAMPESERNTKRRELASELLNANMEKLEINETWEAWLSSPMKRKPSAKTIEGYIAIWRRFQQWAKGQGIEYLHDVSKIAALDYCKDLEAWGTTNRTYNAHLKFLKSMFKTLMDSAGLIVNAWNGIPTKEKQPESRRNLSSKEIARILNRSTGWMRVLLSVGVYTGMRLGDCVQLRWEEIDLDDGMIEHMPLKTQRKRKKVRLAIFPELEQVLRDWQAVSNGSGYLFPEQVELYQKGPVYITKKLQAHFRACGILTTEEPEEGQRHKKIVRVGFHSFRHSFVSLLLKKGVSLLEIQGLVGHSNPRTTEVYTHISDSQIKAIAGKCSGVIPFNPKSNVA